VGYNHPTEIVVVESAIDAMSYYQQHQTNGMLVLSTAGGGRDGVHRWIDAHPKASVTIAFDNDNAGKVMAAAMVSELEAKGRQAKYHAPVQKDWNEDLQCVLEQQRRPPSVVAGFSHDHQEQTPVYSSWGSGPGFS